MPRKVLEIPRYLESLSAEEMTEEIKKLHKLFPDVQEYYKVQLLDNGEEELLAKCKKMLKKAFSPYSVSLLNGVRIIKDCPKLSYFFLLGL